MQSYQDLLSDILENGTWRQNRTKYETIAVFGRMFRHDMSKGFPLTTTKKTAFRLIKEELLWFLRGETNIKSLVEKNVHIWNDWMKEDGELGPVYGKQWRAWTDELGDIDQILQAVDMIKKNPESRRIIVSAWNVGEIEDMALPPCHYAFQFSVDTTTNKLSILVNQRSADVFLGVPFNIASYALLLCMVAQVTNKIPGEVVFAFGDLHIYSNHIEQVRTQILREPFPLPTLKLNPAITDIDFFTSEDIEIENYHHHGILKGEVAV